MKTICESWLEFFVSDECEDRSASGPVLFLIYINDLQTISDIFQFSIFADDTAITISNKDSNDLVMRMTLNDEIHKLSQYARIRIRISISPPIHLEAI